MRERGRAGVGPGLAARGAGAALLAGRAEACGSGRRCGRWSGCGAMGGGRRLLTVLLLALLRGLCHGRQPAPGAVTCGSVLKLLNTRHSVRLHSHEVKYGSGEQAGPGVAPPRGRG